MIETTRYKKASLKTGRYRIDQNRATVYICFYWGKTWDLISGCYFLICWTDLWFIWYMVKCFLFSSPGFRIFKVILWSSQRIQNWWILSRYCQLLIPSLADPPWCDSWDSGTVQAKSGRHYTPQHPVLMGHISVTFCHIHISFLFFSFLFVYLL